MLQDKWTNDENDEEIPRRSFATKAAAILAGSVAGLAPILAAFGFLSSPLIKPDGGIVGSDDGFLPLNIGPDALPADGTPMSFKVVADMVDAWNFFPDQEIGSVWLRRTNRGEIVAFNTICPHLGCSIDYRGAQHDFFCPCHFSSFSLDGAKQNNIPPRNMDGLNVKIVAGQIWIEYQNFRGGIEEKVVV